MTHTYEIFDANLTDIKEALEQNGIICELVESPVFSLGGTAHCVEYKGVSSNTNMNELVAYIEDNALLFNNRVKLYSFGKHCSGMNIIGLFKRNAIYETNKN